MILDKTFAAGSQTGHCTATWPVIYAWTGNGYADVSSKYQNYYRQLLTIPDSTASDVKWRDCSVASTAKIERILGSRDAGLSDAIKWTASEDREIRLFGIEILGDIGTPSAITYLHKLSHNPDREDASFAEVNLETITKGTHVNPTIHGEPLTPDHAAPSSISQPPPTPTSY